MKRLTMLGLLGVLLVALIPFTSSAGQDGDLYVRWDIPAPIECGSFAFNGRIAGQVGLNPNGANIHGYPCQDVFIAVPADLNRGILEFWAAPIGNCFTFEPDGVRVAFARIMFPPPIAPQLEIWGSQNDWERTYCQEVIVRATPCYDNTGDYKVTAADISRVAAYFGTYKGQTNFAVLADNNEDGIVSAGDISRVLIEFGWDCTDFQGT